MSPPWICLLCVYVSSVYLIFVPSCACPLRVYFPLYVCSFMRISPLRESLSVYDPPNVWSFMCISLQCMYPSVCMSPPYVGPIMCMYHRICPSVCISLCVYPSMCMFPPCVHALRVYVFPYGCSSMCISPPYVCPSVCMYYRIYTPPCVYSTVCTLHPMYVSPCMFPP